MSSATVLFAQDIGTSTDTSYVLLPTAVARQVLVDLERGDQNAAVVVKQNEIIQHQKDLLGLDSCIINNMKEQLEIQSKLKTTSDDLISIQRQEIEVLNKELKKERTVKIIFETTTVVATLGLIISLLL